VNALAGLRMIRETVETLGGSGRGGQGAAAPI
jgi:hypothetical protein